jgi:hypothetical protein
MSQLDISSQADPIPKEPATVVRFVDETAQDVRAHFEDFLQLFLLLI